MVSSFIGSTPMETGLKHTDPTYSGTEDFAIEHSITVFKAQICAEQEHRRRYDTKYCGRSVGHACRVAWRNRKLSLMTSNVIFVTLSMH